MIHQRKLYILFLLSLLIAGIGFLSYYDPYGGISMDAPWYLRLAQSLTDGNGMQVMAPDYIHYYQAQNFFIWPPLYSMFTAFISYITNLPVYITVKIVNVICIIVCWMIFNYIFPKKFRELSLIFFHASIFDMFYQGWSETPFVCLLLIELAFVYYFQNKNLTILSISIIIFLSCIATGFRYLGIISIVPLALITYQKHKNHSKKTRNQWLIIFIISTIIQIGFIYLNYFSKNRIIDYRWNPNFDEIKDFCLSFVFQIINQFDIFINPSLQSWYEKILVLISLMSLIYLVRKHKIITYSISKDFRMIFLSGIIMGICYILIPLFMRQNYAIGLNHYRFFSVSSALVLFSVIIYYNITIPKKIILTYIVLVFSINVGLKVYYMHFYNKNITFPERLIKLENKYKNIKPGSVVSFADKWLEFIRPDIYCITPYENVMKNLSPELNTFIEIIKRHQGPVIFEIIKAGDQRMYRYKKSIKDFHLNNQNQEFIQLK